MASLDISPTSRTVVLARLPANTWVTAAALAERTGLTAGAVKRELMALFREGRAWRRPGVTGIEWRRN